MQAASDATDGSMVSVIGLKSDKVQDICDAAAEQSGEPVQVTLFARWRIQLLLRTFHRLIKEPEHGRSYRARRCVDIASFRRMS